MALAMLWAVFIFAAVYAVNREASPPPTQSAPATARPAEPVEFHVSADFSAETIEITLNENSGEPKSVVWDVASGEYRYPVTGELSWSASENATLIVEALASDPLSEDTHTLFFRAFFRDLRVQREFSTEGDVTATITMRELFPELWADE